MTARAPPGGGGESGRAPVLAPVAGGEFMGDAGRGEDYIVFVFLRLAQWFPSQVASSIVSAHSCCDSSFTCWGRGSLTRSGREDNNEEEESGCCSWLAEDLMLCCAKKRSGAIQLLCAG